MRRALWVHHRDTFATLFQLCTTCLCVGCDSQSIHEEETRTHKHIRPKLHIGCTNLNYEWAPANRNVSTRFRCIQRHRDVRNECHEMELLRIQLFISFQFSCPRIIQHSQTRNSLTDTELATSQYLFNNNVITLYTYRSTKSHFVVPVFQSLSCANVGKNSEYAISDFRHT